MKKLTIILLLLSLGLPAIAEETDLAGKWQSEDKNGWVEFTTDGHVKSQAGPAAVAGRYELQKNGRIVLTFEGEGAPPPAQFSYAIAGEILTLKDADGNVVIKFQRLVKELPSRATPQPRKRLQLETGSLEHSTTRGQVAVGVIQTPEARFQLMTADMIQRNFNRLRQSADGKMGGWAKVHIVLRVDSQTKSAEIEKIESDMSDRMKALLRGAVEQCNGSIDVPKELVEKMGRFIVCELNFEFFPPGEAR